MAVNRRRFFELGGLSVLGVAGGRMLLARPQAPAVDTAPAPDEPIGASAEPAVAGEPLVAKRWAMVVDVRKCLEQEYCDKCISACHRAHNVPDLGNQKDEVKWIWREPYAEALPDQHHEYMDEHRAHTGVPVFCNHCDNPPCTRVCPTQATWKRPDGIVMMDWHRCIGCRYCIAACPYGSRSFNWRDPRPFLDELNPEFPTRTRGVVEKCNFCEERLAQGKLPACTLACEEKALVFGDLGDPSSEVRQLLRGFPAVRRRPGLGTKPEVFYLV
jgi:molybdopterin-containing oxidoreductase family iron-sulfur binding subunit